MTNNLISGWNRLANQVVGNSLANDVTASAHFYAVLNYALANAAIASWDTKYFDNSWRSITALNYNASTYLASNTTFTDPSWVPLLDPTPNHQDYLSTHATFGAAAGAVVVLWNGGDEVNLTLSSNVTRIEEVITRPVTRIKQAVKDNGDSRIFGGIHFHMPAMLGMRLGGGLARRLGRLLMRGGTSSEIWQLLWPEIEKYNVRHFLACSLFV